MNFSLRFLFIFLLCQSTLSLAVGLARYPQPRLKGDGILAINNNQLMVWEAGGKVQLGDPKQSWSKILQLPITYVVSVTPAQDGAFLSGSYYFSEENEIGVILRIDAIGTVTQKWTIPSVGIFGPVSSDGTDLFSISFGEVYRLRQEEKAKFERKVKSRSKLIFPVEEQEILCTKADLAKYSFRWASCSSTGRYTWEAEGRWDRYPFLCGGWLIEGGEKNVVVRSPKTGKKEAELALSTESAFTCSNNKGILIAGEEVREARLPDLKIVAEKDIPRFRAKSVAQLGNDIVVLTENNLVLVLE